MQTKWLTMKHDMSNTLADISDVQDVLAMTLGVAKTHVLGVAAELGIADLLKHGPGRSRKSPRQRRQIKARCCV